MDGASARSSARSVKSERETERLRKQKYEIFILKPDNVDKLWEDENPCVFA